MKLIKQIPVLIVVLSCVGMMGQYSEAQVYRYTDAKGRVVYSDAPPTDASSKDNVKTVNIYKPTAEEENRAKVLRAQNAQQYQRTIDQDNRAKSQADVQQTQQYAQDKLSRQQQDQLKQALQPREGDFVGNANGKGSRPTEAFFQRQMEAQKLLDKVQKQSQQISDDRRKVEADLFSQ